MAKFENVKSTDDVYVCDNCKKDINASDIILTETTDNVKILTPMCTFVFVDKNGMLIGGGKQPSEKLGDQLLTCPYCNTPHPFGFSRKEL